MSTPTATTTTPDLGLLRYLRLLAGPSPAGRLLEIRHPDPATPGRMRQRFLPASDLPAIAATIRELAPKVDVYTGVLLRTRPAGGAEAVAPSHLLWAEIDRGDALDQLPGLGAAPTLAIASGTRGHAHVYWVLRHTLTPRQVGAYNRQIAAALGADLHSTDPARILRPPGTLNHKRKPPTAVQLIDVNPDARYEPGRLLTLLGAERPPRAAKQRPTATSRVLDDRRLLEIPAVEYARRLTGRQADRAGKISCPFHKDPNPSLKLYRDGTFYCYGCGVGGSLYDFAARLWGLQPKGRGFVELRARLQAALLAETATGGTVS